MRINAEDPARNNSDVVPVSLTGEVAMAETDVAVEPEGFDEFWRDYLVGLAFTAQEDNEEGCGGVLPMWSNPGGSIEDVVDPDDVERILRECGDYDDLRSDCVDFLVCALEQGLIPEGKVGAAGGDFHLTRNRHGAGFWDGDWECGKELTELSHPYSTCELMFRLKEDADDLDEFESYEWMVVH